MASRATATARRPVAAVKGRLSTATWLTVLVGVLCVIGVIMVGSASSVVSMSLYGSPWSIFFRDLIWIAVGTIFFVLASRFDYHRLRKLTGPLLAISFLGLLVVMAPGVGASAGGASRWVGFGPLRFQPSEFMKLALVLYGADILTKRIEARAPIKVLLAPVLLVAGSSIALVVLQPDLGTAMVLMVITGALFFAAGVPRRIMHWGFGGVVVGVTFLAFAMPYRRARLLSFINPGSKADGSGYQVVQSLIGMGSGGFGGLGLGNSREKWGLLPNAHTDFIFAVVGEEIGMIGCVAVLALFGVFAMKAIRASEEARDLYGTLLGAAIAAWISVEAILNIGAVIGALPVTGIPLPFVSFGGSSLVITMAAAGILINIARQGGQPRKKKLASKAKPSTAKKSSRPASGARAASGRPRATTAR